MLSISFEQATYNVLDATDTNGRVNKVLVLFEMPADGGVPQMRFNIPLDEHAARHLGSLLKGETPVEVATPQIIIPAPGTAE